MGAYARVYLRLMRPVNCLMMGFAVIVGVSLASPKVLSVFWPNLIYGFITGFMLTVEVEKYLVDKQSDSDKFTDDQKELLRRLKPGDQFLIHTVTATGPDGRERKLPSVLFRITPEEPLTHFEEQLKLTGRDY